VHPITYLQKKGAQFERTLDHARSFLRLKSLLISAPILRIGDPDVNFVVCKDECKEGIGGVLSSNGIMACYKSIKLKEN
jgi:hypothetical protein